MKSKTYRTEIPATRINQNTTIHPQQVLYFEAMSNYTMIYFLDGSKKLVSKCLKEIERILDHCKFLRIHHKYLINLNEMIYDSTSIGFNHNMLDGTLPIAKRRIRGIKAVLRDTSNQNS